MDKFVGVRMDSKLYEAVLAEAKRQHLDLSTMIRRALVRELAVAVKGYEKQLSGQARDTALEFMRTVIHLRPEDLKLTVKRKKADEVKAG